MSLREPPYRLCCGQQHWGPVCPDGKIMCQLCYERFDRHELNVPNPLDGIPEDVCQKCADHEDMMLRIRAI
jgi:hypothetical protein